MTSILRLRSSITNQIHLLGSCFNNVNNNASLQVRWAGHAKWQNIKNTKQAGDLAKCRLISRYVQLVKKVIVSNKMQTDPKLNPKLGAVLAEALKLNVPKATLERAIERAQNMKVLPLNLEIKGPEGCTLIARCETENIPFLRRDVRKILKKFEANLMPDGSLINMFKSQGYIRAATKTADGRDINQDYAEEAAIMGNAIEVELENDYIDSDGHPVDVWLFTTEAETLQPCKGELEKQGLQILSTDLELVPYRAIDFGEGTYEKAQQLELALKELEQVLDVFHNLSPPVEKA